jgi:alpha-maltose-1-phosphate synthase
MQIGFLTGELPIKGMSSGGIGTSTWNLARAMVALGHEVVVFWFGRREDSESKEEGVRVIAIKNIQFKGLSWWLTRKKIQIIINKEILKGLRVLEVPDWAGMSSFLNIHCPLVIRLNGTDSFFCTIEKRRLKWKNGFHEKRAFEAADGIIAVSDFVGRTTKEIFHSTRSYKVIPNGIPVQSFNIENAKEEYTILYFGTLIRKKGVLDLAHIFNLVTERDKLVRLILIGKDSGDIKTGKPSTWELMREILSPAAKGRTTFQGSIPYHQISTEIRKAAVCVFPSYAEACPVSWIEAMAMGKAIVASDIGWASELIEDGKEGLLVDPSNHKGFANAILALLTNPEKRENFGLQASRRAKHQFEVSKVAEDSIQFYQQLLN